MGLVLQAPIDAALPLADASAGTGTAPQAGSATDRLFANLLASLSASVDGDVAEGVQADGMPAGELPVDGEAEHKEKDPFAALFAMGMPLPTLPSAQVESLVTKPGDAENGGIAGVAADGQTQGMADPQAAAIDGAPNGNPGATGAPSEATAAAETPATELPETPGPAVDAAMAISAPPVERHGQQEAKRSEATPPTESPGSETAPVASSVVRNVGNAETSQGNEEGSKGEGHRAHADRPLPKASDTAVAHAAANSAVGELRTKADAAPVDAAPAPDTAAPAADVPPQVEHVARTVIERVERGGGEARIHLDPAGLGEVTIHVHTDGDHVRVDVRAERHEAAQLLRDHTQDLSTLLGERGLNLSDVNVGLGRGNRDQTWGREDAPKNRPVSGEFAGILGVGETAPLETHNRLRAAYNPDGALVYRV